MNALCRQTTVILLSLMILLGITPLRAQDDGNGDEYITVSGMVRDQKSKKKLEYVNIAVPGSNIGTVTNSDGEFSVKIKNSLLAKEVQLSHVGYLNAIIPVNGSDITDVVVNLIPTENLLEEIIVRARDPRYIIEEAMSKIAVNYSPVTNMLTGFYRETAQKGRRYINISEAIIDIYKTPYTENVERDRVQIYKGRSLLSQKKSDTLIVKLLGGPNLSVYVDIVKNPDILLDKEMLPYYSFKMEESVMIDKRPQYVISFTPQAILPYALYYGKLYIDKENLAFTRAEFNLNMDDRNKATQAILKKKPFGLRFKPLEVSFLVTYKQRNNLTYLSYIRNEVHFNCDWKRRLFATNYTINSEMVVTDSETEKVNSISYKLAFKPSQSLSDRVGDFMDEDFWGAYNIIEPTESLESAVNKLRKQKQ
ncbi:MAG: carboxypeptidase-like regulatory domain-containing protein [Tannerellaceae bacterium]|nr:carboxypeptidase-like regulatory domain-containing protein [Tannerellaceae bacterium]